jgi:F-type H+-transporting ATPase subunit epsilon
MTNTTKVKIIMPSNILFETDAQMVNIPGGSGMFGVLPGHMKMISTIQVGIVSIFVDEIEQKFFVYGGLAKISGTEVNIVTEFALAMNGQTKADILSKITALKAELEAIEKDSLDFDILNDNIARYNSLLNFVGN